jgi:hypothetical protein
MTAESDRRDADAMPARATLRTTHEDAVVVAKALAPDNTAEMRTRAVDDSTVETTVVREDAAGLGATVDDYLVNVDVADRTYRHATDHTDDTTHST